MKKYAWILALLMVFLCDSALAGVGARIGTPTYTRTFTRTNTPTVTRTPTITHTPTITNTPANTLTPTNTFTPTSIPGDVNVAGSMSVSGVVNVGNWTIGPKTDGSVVVYIGDSIMNAAVANGFVTVSATYAGVTLTQVNASVSGWGVTTSMQQAQSIWGPQLRQYGGL